MSHPETPHLATLLAQIERIVMTRPQGRRAHA